MHYFVTGATGFIGRHLVQELLANRVANRPVPCLPHYRADNMVVIDDNTVVFFSSDNRPAPTPRSGSRSRGAW